MLETMVSGVNLLLSIIQYVPDAQSTKIQRQYDKLLARKWLRRGRRRDPYLIQFFSSCSAIHWSSQESAVQTNVEENWTKTFHLGIHSVTPLHTYSESVATTISVRGPFRAGSFDDEDSNKSPRRRTPSMAASSSARWFVRTAFGSIRSSTRMLQRCSAFSPYEPPMPDTAPPKPFPEQAPSVKTTG